MCLIIYSGKNTNKKKPFLEEAIRKAHEYNGDGMGYAIKRNKNNSLFISKGYEDLDYFIDQIKAEKIGVNDELLVHLRIGNKGAKNAIMCHPFIVSNDDEEIIQLEGVTDKMVIAHNGTMHRHAVLNSDKSDTFFFIKNVMSRESVQNFLYESPIDFVEIMQPHLNLSRLAVMSPDKDTILLGKWYQEEGLYFSKDYFEEYFPKPAKVYNWKTGNYTGQYDEWDEYDDYNYGVGCSSSNSSLKDIINSFDDDWKDKVKLTGLKHDVVCPRLSCSRLSFKNLFGYEYTYYLGLFIAEEHLDPKFVPAINEDNLTHFHITARETNKVYGIDKFAHYGVIGVGKIDSILVYDYTDDTTITIPHHEFYNIFKVSPKATYEKTYKDLYQLITSINVSKTTYKKLKKVLEREASRDCQIENIDFKGLHNIDFYAADVFLNNMEEELGYRKNPHRLMY